MIDERLVIGAEGDLRRVGIVTPPGSQVVAYGNGLLCVFLPGHRYWSGLGRPFAYAPAELVVYRLTNQPTSTLPNGDVEVEGRQVMRLPARLTAEDRRRRAAQTRVILASLPTSTVLP